MFKNWSAMKGHKFIKIFGLFIYLFLVCIIIIMPINNKTKLVMTQPDEAMETKIKAMYNIGENTRLDFNEDINIKLSEYENSLDEATTIAEAPVEEPKQEVESSKYITTADYLNHRTSPEVLDTNIIDVYPGGTMVDVVSIEGDWALLTDGTYVSNFYIEEYIEGETPDNSSVQDSTNSTDETLYEPTAPVATGMGYIDLNYNVFTMSGASTGNMYNITNANPGLSGLEETAISIENEYGINAYFIMALAAWESGRGSSSLAINNNNYFGLRTSDWCSYNSPGESAYHAASSISSYGVYSINDIGYIYCPDGNTDHWINNVVSIMNEFTQY